MRPFANGQIKYKPDLNPDSMNMKLERIKMTVWHASFTKGDDDILFEGERKISSLQINQFQHSFFNVKLRDENYNWIWTIISELERRIF